MCPGGQCRLASILVVACRTRRPVSRRLSASIGKSSEWPDANKRTESGVYVEEKSETEEKSRRVAERRERRVMS
jgi:hypothetical protein